MPWDEGRDREVRRLFSKDEKDEVKSWERPPGTGRKPETGAGNTAGGSFSRKRTYLPNGLLKTESLYKQGKEDLRIGFEYAAGKPARLSYERPEGTGGSYKDEYQFLPSGGFRGLTRTYEDGKVYRSVFSLQDGMPLEEWHSFGDLAILFSYDGRGNLLRQEERREETLTELAEYHYDDKAPSRLRERKTRDYVLDRETLVLYDEEGHPKTETLSEKGIRLSVVRFSYENDRLVKKEKRGKDSRELWDYAYDEKGEMTDEAYSVNGTLKRKTKYPKKGEGVSEDYSSVEEFFKDDKVFLRLYYKDGQEVKSEVLRDGQVIRTKETESKK